MLILFVFNKSAVYKNIRYTVIILNVTSGCVAFSNFYVYN